jgi:succinate-semialdehyde dehydrogenase/glutarate-semialdehyde dehydrogenase
MSIEIHSPVTGDLVRQVEEATPAYVEEVLRTARAAVPALRALSAWERADLLQATADALESRRTQALADHLTEHGKTRSEADIELTIAIRGIRMTAESARRLDGRITAVADRNKKVFVERAALGVIGAITPWNVPFMVPFEYIAPGLAMGNAVVWKPAESVPRTSEHMQAALDEAGWPVGAVQMLPGGPQTGARLARHPELNALCFTGSSEVGRELAGLGGMRKLILELGGNGPTVVFPDCDVQETARRIVAGTTFLSGQSCAATERVLVDERIEGALLEALVSFADAEQVGDPRDDASTLGPVHLFETSEKIRRHISDAVQRGGRVLTGGRSLPEAPTTQYWEPTVLADVTEAMDVFAEETFGPVIPVASFSTEEEAAALANYGGYGLASAVFTQDIGRAFRAAEWLPAPHIVVNNTSNYWEMHLPWGGSPGSRSGVGRLGGDHALIELSTTKSLVVDLSDRT